MTSSASSRRTLPSLPPALPAETLLPPYPGIALTHITRVTRVAEAEQAQAALLACDAVGFDTESKPTFVKGEVSTGPHLVQLASDDHVWLLQTARPECLPVIRAVLEAATVKKIGFGLGNDFSGLRARFGVALSNVLDLGEVLRNREHRGTVGIKTAVERYFGQQLQKSKKIGTSNWAKAELNEAQLRYAADDAHVALRLYRAWQAQGGQASDA